MLVGGRGVKVTNLEKVFFPTRGLTKGDLIDYYVGLAGPVLNHVQGRPMQMKRHPNGVDGDFFYQKRVPVPHPDWLETVDIRYPSGNQADFPVVRDAAGLAWIANLGCIELHTWHSCVDDVTRPDYLLIDLDPGAGDPWEHVREIAMMVKEVLDELGLVSYPKTSGVSGIHVLVPIVPDLVFPEVRRLAKAIAVEVARRVPKIATTTWVVKDRSGVFVDYGQNAYDRTIASAYSIRPVPDARASAPLRWEEVADVDPAAFTLETMPERVARVGDLTADIWSNRQSLRPLFPTLKLKAPVDDGRVLVRPSRAARRGWGRRGGE